MTPFIVFGAKYLIALPVALALGYSAASPRRRAFLAYAALVLMLAFAFGLLARQFYYDPLPFVERGAVPLISHEINNGFPSDHALLAGALAAAMTPFNLPLAALMWLAAVLIGAARVLALVHHPVDIVASFTLAIIAALTANYVIRLFKREG